MMNIQTIISGTISLILEFTVYSPIEDVFKGIILAVADSSPVPWWFSVSLRLIFFVGTFVPMYLLVSKFIGED